MNRDQELSYEVERYELHAGPAYRFEFDRREFFKVLGGGILVVSELTNAFALQESGGGRRRGAGASVPQELGAWLHIGEDGALTVYTGKTEVGQNIRTSLSQVVAEELHVPVGSIRLVMADTDLTPFDMGTFGSRTTPVMAAQLRKVSSAAREVLLDLASQQWQVARAQLVLEAGRILNPATKQSLSFGQLTKGQKLLAKVGSETQAATPNQWKVAGTSVPKVNGRAMVTGSHMYTCDLKRPGMLHGKVVRPGAFNARLAAVDTKAAEAINGVTVIRDGEFMGVAAPDEETAARALSSIRAEWSSSRQPSSGELFAYLKKTSSERDGGSPRIRGSIEQGLAEADKKLRQTYTVAYIAHAPLEPRAALAEWNDGKLTVWTGTQRPFGVRTELAEAFRIPETNVRVIVPDTGSGYGGKHTGEAAVEAARLAKGAGKPVRLVWTREEEFTWAYFRPAGVIEITSGVRNNGFLTAWEFHNYNSGGSAIATLYDVPHQKIAFHPVPSPLRQGSYRALAATANHFARESHMDELAFAVGMDPLKFRTENLKDARLRAVLDAAAEKFGWGRKKDGPGSGFGIAGGFEKGSYVAMCAEVSVDRPSGKVRIVRVVAAFECGAVLNPNHLRNQIEGSIVMGIGGAMFEAIQFDNGRILNPLFSGYRVPRFSDTPAIDIVLLDRKDLPSEGAGETPIVGLAPAVGNAIFDASGTRLTSLPMLPKPLTLDKPLTSEPQGRS